MNDDERDELASAYLDGEVTDEERRTVDDDPALVARVEELRAVSGAVGRAPAPPAAVAAAARENNVAAALAQFAAQRPEAPPSLTAARGPAVAPRPAWRRFVPIGAAAAAVIVLAGIAVNTFTDDAAEDAITADGGSSDTLAAQLVPDTRDELVTPEAQREEAAAADDGEDLEAAADGDDAAGSDAAPASTTQPALDDGGAVATAGPVETTAAADGADGSDAVESAPLDHPCDDAVRSIDPDLGELVAIDEPDDEGRDTLVYALPDDGERRYAVDPTSCEPVERLADPAG